MSRPARTYDEIKAATSVLLKAWLADYPSVTVPLKEIRRLLRMRAQDAFLEPILRDLVAEKAIQVNREFGLVIRLDKQPPSVV